MIYNIAMPRRHLVELCTIYTLSVALAFFGVTLVVPSLTAAASDANFAPAVARLVPGAYDDGRTYETDKKDDKKSDDEKSDDKKDEGGGHVGVNIDDDSQPCKIKTMFDWGCKKSSKQPLLAVVSSILKWLAAGMTVIVVLAISYAGYLYIASGDSKDKSALAKKIIRNAITALIAYFFMYAILNFIVPGGLFG